MKIAKRGSSRKNDRPSAKKMGTGRTAPKLKGKTRALSKVTKPIVMTVTIELKQGSKQIAERKLSGVVQVGEVVHIKHTSLVRLWSMLSAGAFNGY